jgi:hypothetical protein
VKSLEDIGIPELTSEQTESLCAIAEEAARKHVLSKVSQKNVEVLNVCAEVEGTRPVRLTVDVDVELAASAKGVNAEKLVDEATEVAFKAAEKYLRELKCPSFR